MINKSVSALLKNCSNEVLLEVGIILCPEEESVKYFLDISKAKGLFYKNRRILLTNIKKHIIDDKVNPDIKEQVFKVLQAKSSIKNNKRILDYKDLEVLLEASRFYSEYSELAMSGKFNDDQIYALFKIINDFKENLNLYTETAKISSEHYNEIKIKSQLTKTFIGTVNIHHGGNIGYVINLINHKIKLMHKRLMSNGSFEKLINSLPGEISK